MVPAQVSFPMTGVGATSNPTTLTIANSGSSVALTGVKLAASAGFKTDSEPAEFR